MTKHTLPASVRISSQKKLIMALLWGLMSVPVAMAQLTVTLAPSVPSGQPVGTVVTWTASVTNNANAPGYRFSVQAPDGSVRILRDFAPDNTLDWTALKEGTYLMVAVVSDGTGATAVAYSQFQFTSRVTGGTPVVSATNHPLVALYSAPPCAAGSVRVYFRPSTGGFWQETPTQPCQGSKSLNFYVAGMRQNTTYTLVQQLTNAGTVTYGPLLSFQTGAIPFSVPPFVVTQLPNAATSLSDPILLTGFWSDNPAYQTPTVATDLLGDIVWYDPDLVGSNIVHSYLLRPSGSGTFLDLLSTYGIFGQRLREVDLAGNLVRETSVGRINQQLTAMGKPLISWLSHEALRLPNGHTLTLGSVEKILTDVQGPGPVDVVGDMILDLDSNFQVTWTWDSFDWLDTSRMATLNDTCVTFFGCPPLRLASVANDWTHANSIFYLPDHNLLLSIRHQDWIVKINYQNGTGTGQIMWRLGEGGDFTVNSSDPWPWFSHQHDASIHNGLLTVYDNGNTRIEQTGSGDSRGQVWLLNEKTKTATLLLNADMGTYSSALGSARVLSNGNYHFLTGCIYCKETSPPYFASQSVELLPNGTPDYGIAFAHQAYRSFRLKDMYTYVP